LVAQLQISDLVYLVHVLLVRPESDLHARPDRAVHHADAGNGAAIAIVVRVEDQGAERRLGRAPGRWDAAHDGLEQLGHVRALLGRDAQDLLRLRPDQLVNLLGAAIGLGSRQVDLERTGMISSPASRARNRLEIVCAWMPWDASTTRIAP